MGLVNNSPANIRKLNDGNFVSKQALGTSSTGFNLVQTVPYPTTEQATFVIETTALAGNDLTAAFAVQDSADGVTYTNVSKIASYTIDVPNSTGAAAATASYLLPPDVKQYVRVSSSSGGGATGGYTASLAF